MISLYAGTNTHIIEVKDLTLQPSGDLVTGATVEARVLDESGSVVAGTSDPITLVEDSAVEGRYEGKISAEASIQAFKWHTVEISADTGTVQAEWRETTKATPRDV